MTNEMNKYYGIIESKLEKHLESARDHVDKKYFTYALNILTNAKKIPEIFLDEFKNWNVPFGEENKETKRLYKTLMSKIKEEENNLINKIKNEK